MLDNKLNNKTINHYSHVGWLVNTGNFNGECCVCGWQIKKGDKILVESDVTNGLNINRYCNTGCGNSRLFEYSEYYKGLINE